MRRALSTLAASLLLCSPLSALATPLDPKAYPSLGDLDLLNGTLDINTSTAAMTGAFTATGVKVGTATVFTFGRINLGAAVTLQIITNDPTPPMNGPRPPLILLSQGDATIAANISVSARRIIVPPSSSAGVGGGYGGLGTTALGIPGSGGAGGMGGGRGGSGMAGGNGGSGGFGGAGRPAPGPLGGMGGGSSGDLLKRLEGGSGGGGGGGHDLGAIPGGHGGSAGGALELGAVGILTLTGDLVANGIGGRSGGGDGSGGGFLLHGREVRLLGTVNAASNTAGGGGGRVALIGLPSYRAGTMLPGVLLTGYRAGVLTVVAQRTLVPAGSTATLEKGMIVTPGQKGDLDPRLEAVVQRDLTVEGGASLTVVGMQSLGTLTLESGAILAMAARGLQAGTGHDQLRTEGLLLAGTLRLKLSFALRPGEQLVLLSQGGTEPVQGRFSGVEVEGASGAQIDYRGGDGNDVVLSLPLSKEPADMPGAPLDLGDPAPPPSPAGGCAVGGGSGGALSGGIAVLLWALAARRRSVFRLKPASNALLRGRLSPPYADEKRHHSQSNGGRQYLRWCLSHGSSSPYRTPSTTSGSLCSRTNGTSRTDDRRASPKAVPRERLLGIQPPNDSCNGAAPEAEG